MVESGQGPFDERPSKGVTFAGLLMVESGQGPFDERPSKGVTFAGLMRVRSVVLPQ
jgi:hypothetical protein